MPKSSGGKEPAPADQRVLTALQKPTSIHLPPSFDMMKNGSVVSQRARTGKMGTVLLIRSERDDDHGKIAEVVTHAYAAVPWSDHREHLMVERLRQTEAFLPALSLVAEVDGEAVGHLLLTRAWIENGSSATVTLALAPLSVVPDWQNDGVGKGLIREAHRRAMALGFRSVLCVGNPTYYPRFGYQPLANYPITLPFDAPTDNQMILPLAPSALHGVKGMVRYAAGWVDR